MTPQDKLKEIEERLKEFESVTPRRSLFVLRMYEVCRYMVRYIDGCFDHRMGLVKSLIDRFHDIICSDEPEMKYLNEEREDEDIDYSVMEQPVGPLGFREPKPVSEECSKCGKEDLNIRYCDGKWIGGKRETAGMNACSSKEYDDHDEEMLHICCRTCGHTWSEKTIEQRWEKVRKADKEEWKRKME